MRQPERNVMKSVRLEREELLNIVSENKQKHIVDFKESLADYKKAVVKICKENSELARSGDLGKIRQIRSMPSAPVSYEDSYTRAARMLELSIDDVVELDETTFNQLVLDEWTWKNQFTTSSTFYKTVLTS
jgi:hypothetical protein